MLIYYILEILKRYSDSNHKLSQSKIASLVRDVYGMECDRKAVGRNIALLTDAGFDIEIYEENSEGYYLKDKLFDDSEIRMLIDAVMASRYISGNYAKDITDKLSSLATVYFTKRINYISQAARWLHTDNPSVFLNVELFDEAIDTHRKVKFTYNQYRIDKKLHPRHDYSYEVDPYQIICNNGRYYLVGNYDRHDCVTNFRIDLITDVEILTAKAIPFEELPNKSKSLDIAEYAKFAVNMYDGKKIDATIRVKEERIGDIIDWFGKDIMITKGNDGYVDAVVTGTDNGLRIWALQYGRIAEIVAPKGLRELVKNDLVEVVKKYS